MKKLINELGEIAAAEKVKFIVQGVIDGLIFYGHGNWSNYERSAPKFA
ncbi:hypothetical protein LF296_03170 [Acinetobacter vivianii]|uniref:Uncharacterized protein n=1 Tax=Acinetobacter vivianii TaxID=1776742 RepID=A0AAJ6NK29_9GAMM|nr:hypothetical protein [Acinetobacter vivianii]WDZ51812.1 hypothetical protein LF296_03170 [Acinetobacter vivianii]